MKNEMLLCVAAIFVLLMSACVSETQVVPASTSVSTETPVVVTSTSTSAPPCTSDAWEVIGQVDFGQPTISVMFRDPGFGIATDLGGGIHYTGDGGKTWTLATDAGFSRVALDMNADTIWHIAYGGALLRSGDDGRTWKHISQLPHSGHIEYVSFSDSMNGWFVSTELRKLFITTDDGETWNALSLPDGMGRVASIQQRTTQDGYLLDTGGNLFITRDGGLTWTSRSLPLAGGMDIPNQNHSIALRFLDENNGLAALNQVGGGSSKVYVLRTADGGSTWNEEPLPLSIGMFFLTRDGALLTYVDLLDHAKFTLLCAPRSGLKQQP